MSKKAAAVRAAFSFSRLSDTVLWLISSAYYFGDDFAPFFAALFAFAVVKSSARANQQKSMSESHFLECRWEKLCQKVAFLSAAGKKCARKSLS
jgi:hypothetical protein